ncbi:MAG: DUF6102 family protein [Christensenella sp.]
MGGIIQDWLTDWIISIYEGLIGIFNNIQMTVLFVERSGTSAFNSNLMENLTQFIYSIGLSLCILKLLKKGFMVYIMWRDGDADNSPLEMLQGGILGVVIALIFPTLYEWFAAVIEYINTNISSIILNSGVNGAGEIPSIISPEAMEALSSIMLGKSLVNLIFCLIYVIMIAVFYFKYLKTGAELFIMRLGISFACLGLIDSDNGVFKPYIQQLFKFGFTLVLQNACFNISMLIITYDATPIGMVWAIAFLTVACSAPQLLSQFMVYAGGGGGLQKATGVVYAANALKGLVK